MFIEFEKFFPGQLKCSKTDVSEKKIELKSKQEYWKLDIQKVVKAPYGYVLIDGHHHFLAYRELMEEEKSIPKQIPVEIVEDLSHLNEREFFTEGIKLGLIWPKDLIGNVQMKPKKDWDLEDDPNLYFVKRSKGHLKKRENQAIYSLKAKNDYPIWIKIEKDIPFIEMVIAEALRSGAPPNTFLVENQRQYEIGRRKLISIQKNTAMHNRHRKWEPKIENTRLLNRVHTDEIPKTLLQSWLNEYKSCCPDH